MEHPSQSQRYPWRLFWLLFVIGILGILAIIPIAIDLFGTVVQTAQAPPIPLPLLILIGVAQNLGMLAAMVFVGLKLGQKLGLGAPLLERWLTGNSLENQWRKSLNEGVITGI